MAGLLAWAADVVGGNANSDPNDEDGLRFIVPKFTPEQEDHMRELDRKATSLQKNLQLLRQRIPPSNIAQSLPYLHADTVASNSALALQLHAHSATRLQIFAKPLVVTKIRWCKGKLKFPGKVIYATKGKAMLPSLTLCDFRRLKHFLFRGSILHFSSSYEVFADVFFGYMQEYLKVVVITTVQPEEILV